MSDQSTNQIQTQAPTLSESFNVIVQSLNKACKTGVYNLDEAYVVKHNLLILQKYLSDTGQL